MPDKDFGGKIEGSTNSDVFRVFVEKILVNYLWSGAVVVMVNLSAPFMIHFD